jgi:hypothetical protein
MCNGKGMEKEHHLHLCQRDNGNLGQDRVFQARKGKVFQARKGKVFQAQKGKVFQAQKGKVFQAQEGKVFQARKGKVCQEMELNQVDEGSHIPSLHTELQSEV